MLAYTFFHWPREGASDYDRHVAEFLQAIRATIVAPPDVKFHSIASSMDLADVTAGRSRS